MNRSIAIYLAIAGCLGCQENLEIEMGTAPPPEPPQVEASAAETLSYLRMIAPRIARRPINADELAVVQEQGPDAIEGILQSWFQEPAFIVAMRDMMEHLLKTSGKLGEIDYDLPGNLAAHIAARKLPYSTLLTADYCVDADRRKTDCDTSAPYAAGVLTTRAYLSANASRFNLRRSTTLMNVFSCRGYPMNPQLQPSVKKEDLIPMFRAVTPEEQTVEEASNGFGNGFGCYTCHSQFASHAQLFVKFDSTGLWRSYAHGLQNDYGELGRSTGRFFASHFSPIDRSENENTQVFGTEVENLTGAAQAIVAEEKFVACAVRRTFEYAFDIDETISAKTDAVLYDNIAARLDATGHQDPTFQQLFTSVLTDPLVIRSAIEQR
jgi:hypothetical protein